MNLNFIKTARCPHCDAIPVAEQIETGDNATIRTHPNGQRWEHRSFACRHKISYNPAAEREQVSMLCHNDPALAEQRRQRAEAVEKTREFIKSLRIDEEFRHRLLATLPDWIIH